MCRISVVKIYIFNRQIGKVIPPYRSHWFLWLVKQLATPIWKLALPRTDHAECQVISKYQESDKKPS